MTYEQAKQEFFSTLKETYSCLTNEELIARLGATTIRCMWVDYCDTLVKDKRADEKEVYDWGQVL